LTQRHRAQQLLLRRATVAQVAKLWPALDWARLDASYPNFALSVAALVQRNRQTSAGLSAQYLRAFRLASGVPGQLKIVHAEPLIVDQFTNALRVTSVVAAKKSAAAGKAADLAMSDALTMTQGAMARLVLDGGRETATLTGAKDDRSPGFRRVLGGGGCDWCRPFIDDEIHYTDGYDFDAHDHCGCTVEPVY
jgi:hypothetical protein